MRKTKMSQKDWEDFAQGIKDSEKKTAPKVTSMTLEEYKKKKEAERQKKKP